jgi:hypothetical protein
MLEKYILILKKFGTSMNTEHLVRLHIHLEPVGLPWIQISVADQTISQQLTTPTDFNFEFTATDGPSNITVTHFDKSSNDPLTAVVVKSVNFFGIQDSKFIWRSEYCPIYPEPWLSAQKPPPAAVLTSHNYLSWNGTWRLDFDVPVFTWMHKVLDFGWIYD